MIISFEQMRCTIKRKLIRIVFIRSHIKLHVNTFLWYFSPKRLRDCWEDIYLSIKISLFQVPLTFSFTTQFPMTTQLGIGFRDVNADTNEFLEFF